MIRRMSHRRSLGMIRRMSHRMSRRVSEALNGTWRSRSSAADSH